MGAKRPRRYGAVYLLKKEGKKEQSPGDSTRSWAHPLPGGASAQETGQILWIRPYKNRTKQGRGLGPFSERVPGVASLGYRCKTKTSEVAWLTTSLTHWGGRF
jgi:hypothetical protein